MPRRLFLIELFAGTHSVSKAVKRSLSRDFEIRLLSVALQQKFAPTIVADINSWRYKPAIDEFLADSTASDVIAVWASPPCQEYSLAKNGRPRDIQSANRNVRSALKIIRYAMSRARQGFFFIENPVGHLQFQPIIQHLNRYSTCYCKHGFHIMKPTHIWSNVVLDDLQMCTSKTPCDARRMYGRHIEAVQSNQGLVRGLGGGEKAFPVPAPLVRFLFKRGIEQFS